jgi:hypothetical protein
MNSRVYILRLFNHDGSPLPRKEIGDDKPSLLDGFEKVTKEGTNANKCELQKKLVGVFLHALRHEDGTAKAGPCNLVRALVREGVALDEPQTRETDARRMDISLDGSFLGSFGYRPCERTTRTNATRFAVVSCDRESGRYTGHVYVYLPDVTYSESPGTSLGDHVPCVSAEVVGVANATRELDTDPRVRYYHENATAGVRSEWIRSEPDNSASMIGTGTLTLPLLVGAVQVARAYQRRNLSVPNHLGTSITNINTGHSFDTWYASVSSTPLEFEVLDYIPAKVNDGAPYTGKDTDLRSVCL